MQRYQRNGTVRGGFTLTEILVVVAIIAILAAMSAWAAVAMIANRQRSNTEATLRVLNKLMLTRWAAVVADAKKETPTTEVLTFAGQNTDVARVLWIKVRLAEAFPMTYAETFANNPNTIVNTYIPNIGRRKPYFLKYQKAFASLKSGTPGESSACLLMALKSIQADGTSLEDQVKHAIATDDGSPLPVDGTVPVPAYPAFVNTINTLVDGYGCPLKFQRFFTGAPNPAPPGARNFRFGDTTDSDGRLITPRSLWYNVFHDQFEPPPKGTGPFHVISTDDVNSNYVIPMAWSMGRDRKAATFSDRVTPLPSAATPNGNEDNIYSYLLGVE